ncbi:hypothetical protein [Lactococcus garvieae]|jgi:hypothetical protein|uniref:hypothetical protein n=1 Tax=Lactococcus garvieae TaxID=1363 RepID=UPI0009BE44DC|nr:hypothetical protein [Lactococcus garvieae]
MKRAKICALIGSVFTTLIAVLMIFAFIRFIINWEAKGLELTLSVAGHSGIFLLKLFALLLVVIISIMIVNWIAFIRMDRPTGGLWQLYQLVIGSFYILASMVNLYVMVIALPLGLCFVLAFVLARMDSL